MTVENLDPKIISDDKNPNQNSGGSEESPGLEGDKVAYSTYQKVLGEKKKQQERTRALEMELEAIKEAKKAQELEDLKAKEDYKTLAELREQELLEAKGKLAEVEAQKIEAKKLNSFLKAIGGKIAEKYWGLIDLDKIVVNPDTKEVDEMSVTKLVENYKNSYAETIINPNVPQMPNHFPQGAQNSITYDEWLKLPAKDMKNRLKDVIK